MSRVNSILVLIIAFSSICFGATLMQQSMKKAVDFGQLKTSSTTYNSSCQKLIDDHREVANQKIAEALYKEAFILNFNGQWQEAQIASECAANLANGSHHWQVEAKSFLK